MKKTAGKIEELARNKDFMNAYALAKNLNNSKDKFILKAILYLEKELFRNCMQLANNKATEQSKELLGLESLLKKVKALKS